MTANNISDFIKNYNDFPKPGICFRDILPILQEPQIFESLINKISKLSMIQNSEALIGIDARGFIFGSAISLRTKKPFIAARKEGKLPGELVGKSYSLEYGENKLFIQKEAINRNKSFCIIDDLLATGGTASCVEKILLDNNKTVLGLCVIVELTKLEGRKKLICDVSSEIKFD